MIDLRPALTLLLGSAVTWPAVAQAPRPMPRIISAAPTGWRDTTGWRLVLEREITPAEGSAGELGNPSGIAMLPDGGVVVVDDSPVVLKLFDAAGKFVRTIGREGAGPGEYREPTVAANDRWIIMHDYQLARVTLFRRDGTVAASFPATCCSGGLSPTVDDRGRIATPAFTAGRTWWVRFDSTGRRLDSMPQPAAMEPATWNVNVNGGSARYNVPLAPVNVHLRLGDGRVVHGRTDRYEFLVTRTGTDTAMVFGRSGMAATRVPAAMRDSLFRDRVRRSPQLQGVAKLSDIPERYSLWNQLHRDGQNNIWVARGRQASGAMQFDVFSPAGAFLGTVPRPWGAARTSWAGDRVAVLDTDDDDLPRVRVFRIVKR